MKKRLTLSKKGMTAKVTKIAQLAKMKIWRFIGLMLITWLSISTTMSSSENWKIYLS